VVTIFSGLGRQAGLPVKWCNLYQSYLVYDLSHIVIIDYVAQ